MYFDKFPTVDYNFRSIGVEDQDVLDIFIRVKFLFDDIFTSRAYETYTMKHGDTADIIAHQHYGSSDWWWLVLLYNNIINPFNELPRLGLDYKSIPGEDAEPVPMVYIQREGGDINLDFKQGDIIVKIRDESVGTREISTGYRTWVQPQPFQPSDSNFATAKINKWRSSFREATLSEIQGGGFYVGDDIGVLVKNKNEPARLAYWGKILLSLTDSGDSISHFVDNRSGRIVHPSYSIEERIIKPSGPLYNKGDITNSISGTLINAVLGGSGSSGSTYANNFTAVVNKETFDDYSKSRIKLLDPSFKEDAYDLLVELLGNRKLTYATFNSVTRKTNKSSFFGLPSGNTPIITDTIY